MRGGRFGDARGEVEERVVRGQEGCGERDGLVRLSWFYGMVDGGGAW